MPAVFERNNGTIKAMIVPAIVPAQKTKAQIFRVWWNNGTIKSRKKSYRAFRMHAHIRESLNGVL